MATPKQQQQQKEKDTENGFKQPSLIHGSALFRPLPLSSLNQEPISQVELQMFSPRPLEREDGGATNPLSSPAKDHFTYKQNFNTCQ